MKIPRVQWESREYNENLRNTLGIPEVRWESREYEIRRFPLEKHCLKAVANNPASFGQSQN